MLSRAAGERGSVHHDRHRRPGSTWRKTYMRRSGPEPKRMLVRETPLGAREASHCLDVRAHGGAAGQRPLDRVNIVIDSELSGNEASRGSTLGKAGRTHVDRSVCLVAGCSLVDRYAGCGLIAACGGSTRRSHSDGSGGSAGDETTTAARPLRPGQGQLGGRGLLGRCWGPYWRQGQLVGRNGRVQQRRQSSRG